MKTISLALICSAIMVLNACKPVNSKKEEKQASHINLELKATSEAFNKYWYNGLAELNSFELRQARYGEIHEGEMVMIFVSEDFLTHKQVKKESSTQEEAVSVLKMNLDRQFTTGIYDYSMMSSVFTPITEHQWQQPIKVSTSSQEWCGHSWTQLNQNSSGYEFKQYSYFEAEADLEMELDKLLIEDGIWNQIRLNPGKIDTGEASMLPASQYIRLSHIEPKAYRTIIRKGDYLKEDMPGEQLKLIRLDYPELDRSLEIIYEADYPHKITGFKESMKSGFGQNRKNLLTVAKRKASIRLDYWNKNQVEDSTYREKLKLNYY
jgi:hypothetical protein